MGSKRRFSSIEEKRNGMEMRIPGDKYYRLSEHFPNYYKDGGLIPGSTNVINYNKTQSRKAYNFYETLDRNKLWENKVKNENLNFDKKYVEKSIIDWEKNILNDFDPNYSKKKNEIIEENIKKVQSRGAKRNTTRRAKK